MRLRRFLPWIPPALLTPAVILPAYSSGPLPKLTGGFKEKTCTVCHNSFELNEGRTLGGTFNIMGVPKTYSPGNTYPLTIVLGQPGQSRWGFELSARLAASGQQAGRLVPTDQMTQVIEADGIQYIAHTALGTRPGTIDGPVEFHFNWIAPDPAAGPVLFNAAGNAANANANPTGDYIYTASAYSSSTAAPPAMTESAGPKPPERIQRRLDASRVVDLPSPVDLKKGSMEIHIQHRFYNSLAASKPGDAFGVDSGANINLGFNYALTDRMSMGISRARFDQVVNFTGAYELRTRKDSFWKMSLVGGIEGQRNFERQFSPYLQLATSFDYKALRFHIVPTEVFHSRNYQLAQTFKSTAVNLDSKNTFALGLGADVALTPWFSLVGEYIPRLAGFGGYVKQNPATAAGIELRTWGHTFTIVVSRNRDFTPAKYAMGYSSPTTYDPLDSNKFSLGFNIYRRMR